MSTDKSTGKANDDRYVDNNSGPYPDGDPRNITLQPSDNPIEPPRSGPAEDAYRGDDDALASANAAERAKGESAKPTSDPASSKPAVGETSADPAVRARADANRPLGS